MSARDAYIAGRSGGRRPPEGAGSGPRTHNQTKREKAAFDAGQAERRREQKGPSKTIKVKSGKTEHEQARIIAKEKGKDPDNVLTKKEKIKAGIVKPKQSIFSKIGHAGSDYDPDFTVDKEDYKKKGKHKLRTQFDYLTDKYYGGNAEAFAKTSQGKQLLQYLAGVSVERGGGMGAQDPEYGGLVSWDQFSDPVQAKAEKERQALLKGIYQPKPYAPPSLMDSVVNPGITALKDFTKDDWERIRGNLTASQYQNFQQQLIHADPTIGNRDYETVFPSMGKKIENLLQFAPGVGIASKFIKETFPQDTSEYTRQDLGIGQALNPSLFYDLDEIEQSGLMGTEVAMNAQNDIDYNDPDDPDDDPPPGYDSWGEFYASSGISEGEGKWVDGQYYFNYADGGIASLDNGQFDAAEADSLMFRDPVENDEWEYNV